MIFTVKLVLSNRLIHQAFQLKSDRLPSGGHHDFPNSFCSKLGEYHLLSTSKRNLPFSHTIGNWLTTKSIDDPLVTYVEIDRRRPYKTAKFLGFGCSFTDSDLDMLQRIPSSLLDSLFGTYFSANALNFELLRVPIDTSFEAKQRIYANRLNNNAKVDAVIQPETSPNSLRKFVESMDKNQIGMLTLDSNCSDKMENVIDKVNQIHALVAAINRTMECKTPKICLMDCTHRIEQPWLFQLRNTQNNILDKIDMISLTNHLNSPKFLCRSYKNCRKPILFTNLEEISKPSVDSWQEAEQLIDNLMALLHQNIAGYFEDSLISNARAKKPGNSLLMIGENDSKLIKQLAFYAMAHFSRHILPDSKRLTATLCGPMAAGIKTIAYLRPDAKILVLLYNPNGVPVPMKVVDKHMGHINAILQPKSINSIIYCI